MKLLIAAGMLASLFHFADNTFAIDNYPEPAWITPFGIVVSWCIVTGIGIVALTRKRVDRLFYATAGVYALVLLSGLLHYVFVFTDAHGGAQQRDRAGGSRRRCRARMGPYHKNSAPSSGIISSSSTTMRQAGHYRARRMPTRCVTASRGGSADTAWRTGMWRSVIWSRFRAQATFRTLSVPMPPFARR